ncbi:hypothetical protein, partial [Mucilaginibacter sp.]|uniref:hypothetical protein n=1 Tax=Mucilaginibacter sp. TaxID=1882438 RepID=UPI0035BC8DF9
QKQDCSKVVLAFAVQDVSAITHMSTFYLQSLHFYLQSKCPAPKLIQVLSLHQPTGLPSPILNK